MIDFERLVEELLLCETISTETTVSPVKEVFTAIHGTYTSVPPLPTDPSFYNTVQNNIFTRGSAYSLSEDDMIPHYPYIDYLCYINERCKNGSTNIKLDADVWSSLTDFTTPTELITEMTGDWLSYFTNTGHKPADSKLPADRHPVLDYLPMSEALKGLRSKLIEILLAKGVLGKMAMKNYVDNNYNLAEAINSAVSLSQTTISLINRKQEDKNLNYILLNPDLYALGSPKAASGFSRITAPLTQPKQLPEKYKKHSESIFAIAQSIPGYSTSASVSASAVLKFPVSKVQGDATSITEAKLIIQQLQAMSNTLPGSKDLAGKIAKVNTIVGDMGLNVKMHGT
jgi:hypothetical protein